MSSPGPVGSRSQRQSPPRAADKCRAVLVTARATLVEVTRAITATGDFGDDAFTNALLRHDLAKGTVQTRKFGRDATVGEAVFAPEGIAFIPLWVSTICRPRTLRQTDLIPNGPW